MNDLDPDIMDIFYKKNTATARMATTVRASSLRFYFSDKIYRNLGSKNSFLG